MHSDHVSATFFFFFSPSLPQCCPESLVPLAQHGDGQQSPSVPLGRAASRDRVLKTVLPAMEMARGTAASPWRPLFGSRVSGMTRLGNISGDFASSWKPGEMLGDVGLCLGAAGPVVQGSLGEPCSASRRGTQRQTPRSGAAGACCWPPCCGTSSSYQLQTSARAPAAQEHKEEVFLAPNCSWSKPGSCLLPSQGGDRSPGSQPLLSEPRCGVSLVTVTFLIVILTLPPCPKLLGDFGPRNNNFGEGLGCLSCTC